MGQGPVHNIEAQSASVIIAPSDKRTGAMTGARLSTYGRRQVADQLAPTLRRASLDRHRHAVDCQCAMGGNDLVDAMRLATRVGLRTVDFVAKPSNRSAANIVCGRTADNGAAMIGLIADRDNRFWHVASNNLNNSIGWQCVRFWRDRVLYSVPRWEFGGRKREYLVEQLQSQIRVEFQCF